METTENMSEGVVLFGKENCVACAQAKKYLTEKNIDFLYIDVGIDSNREMFIQQTGVMSVPALGVNGKLYVGFNRTLYDGIFEGAR